MTVHVWGPPEETMDDDGRLCTSPDAGELVVYHVAPVRSHADQWLCAECRFRTTETRQAALRRMRSH